MIHRDEQRSRSLAGVPISRRRRQLRTFLLQGDMPLLSENVPKPVEALSNIRGLV